MTSPAVRYAVYLAPAADSALWRFGSAVLGYDAETGGEPAAPDLPGFDAGRWRVLTEEPRRYGFHGTLKPPFRLAAGAGEAALIAAVAAFAAAHHPFELAPLAVDALGPFVALRPEAAAPALVEIAACAVRDLDHLRAPLNPQEIARRRPDRLSARQRAYLDRYGYPYVLDEFRFHMTLTGPLEAEERGHALNGLRDLYAAWGAHGPAVVDDVGLYVQRAPGDRFRLERRFPLGAGRRP